MKPEEIVEALRHCAAILNTPSGTHALRHASMFAEFMCVSIRCAFYYSDKNRLASLVGLQEGVRPTRAAADVIGPFNGEIKRHIGWMLTRIPNIESLPKRCRWIGFAAGAAKRVGCKPAYPVEDTPNMARDLYTAITLARATKSKAHCYPHFVLGYLQGFLWAAGCGSIDFFRRMNLSSEEALRASA